ncbi:MAG: hypothetical protein NZ840_03500 [Anaerolineales bacterium]|nr:hypothetical protein [Anaerolineales bacterium]MDW8161098.1 hypothetical protein [Anaerolineales bacterium]
MDYSLLVKLIELGALIVPVFLMPGLALVHGLSPKWKQFPIEVYLSIAIGASLAFYPLLFLFSRLVGLPLRTSTLGVTLILLGVWLFYSVLKERREVYEYFRVELEHALHRQSAVSVGLLIVFAALWFVRFWAIRSLPLPMWGDSVHHTLIVQLLIENGGLFESWEPYAELQSLTYHFGFHAAVAVYALLGGLSAAKATLVVGQILNVFAVTSLSALSWKISKGNRWATLFSWVLAGFVFFMPMYYTNWGRYTQLCGQVLLPIVVLLLWELMEKGYYEGSKKWGVKWVRERPWREILLVAVVTSGLALIHYRVFLFMLGCIPALLVLTYSRQHGREQFTDLVLGGVIGFLFYLPWFTKVYGGKLYQGFVRGITTSPSALSDYAWEYNAIGNLGTYLPVPVWVLLVVSIVWGIWRQDKRIFFVAAWWGVVLLMANPDWIGLPGAGLLSNFAVFIAIYLPAALILGTVLAWLMETIQAQIRSIAQILGLGAVVVTLLLTWRSRIQDIQPDLHAMATGQDLRAMEWIQANTPQQTRILVNSFFAYGGSTVVGSDGGWWIPFLTKRKISVPPMPYTAEEGPFPNYVEYVNSLRRMIEEKGYVHPDVVAELKARGYEYAYIGEKQGRVNYDGPVVMKPKLMLASGLYELAYHKGRVWVLRIK